MLKACELAPEIAESHYLLGLLYMQKGDNDKAKESLSKAHSLGHAAAGVQLEKL